MFRKYILTLLCALTVPATFWAKDEILPTKKGKGRDQRAEENPLYDVAEDMDHAARRLKETKTDDTTQGIQEAIIEKLNKLIEQAEKESEKQPQGGKGDDQRNKPQPKPQPQPSPEEQRKKEEAEKREQKPTTTQEKKKDERPGIGRPGQGEPGGPLHTDAEEWGNLPPAIREQVLQAQGEGFPLKYRELLRRYYLELSKPKE